MTLEQPRAQWDRLPPARAIRLIRRKSERGDPRREVALGLGCREVSVRVPIGVGAVPLGVEVGLAEHGPAIVEVERRKRVCSRGAGVCVCAHCRRSGGGGIRTCFVDRGEPRARGAGVWALSVGEVRGCLALAVGLGVEVGRRELREVRRRRCVEYWRGAVRRCWAGDVGAEEVREPLARSVFTCDNVALDGSARWWRKRGTY